MEYIIKNISGHDIKWGNSILKSNYELKTNNLKIFDKLIKEGKVEVVNLYNIKREEIIETKNIAPTSNIINEKIKLQLTESIFKLHLQEEMNYEEIDILKWFFKKFYKINNAKCINALDNVTNKEEFIEVLLNVVYPHIFDVWLNQVNK